MKVRVITATIDGKKFFYSPTSLWGSRYPWHCWPVWNPDPARALGFVKNETRQGEDSLPNTVEILQSRAIGEGVTVKCEEYERC